MKVGLHGRQCEHRASRDREVKALILHELFRSFRKQGVVLVGTACRDPAGFAGQFTLG
jgi:hypothetical protein